MAAVKKHGRENFVKRVLHVFETEAEMNAKEAELVTQEFCDRDDNYNLCAGGRDGFSYLNATGLNKSEAQRLATSSRNKHDKETGAAKARVRRKWKDIEWSEKERAHRSLRAKKRKTFLGRKHSEETLNKMRASYVGKHSGEKNSQFDTIWITNGTDSRKIRSSESIPYGWQRGRKIKKMLTDSYTVI